MKLFLPEKQAGNTSNKLDEDFVAMVDKLLEHKCITTKQHKFLNNKCLNYLKKVKVIQKSQNVIIYDTNHQKYV